LPQAALGLGTGGAGLKGAIASGIVPGAIADFMLANPDDGNLSNLARELVPEEYRETFLFALAADEEDNPWMQRLKATIEGAALGAAFDSLLWMTYGRFAARAARKSGLSELDSLQKGLDVSSSKKAEIEVQRLRDAEAEGVQWSRAQEAEMRQLNMEEADFQRAINEAQASGVPSTDPTIRSMQSELDRVQMSKIQLENEIVSGYRPDSPDLMIQEKAASNSVGNVNKAAVQQAQVSSGPIPKALRRPGVTPRDVGPSSVPGSSERLITDANYRLMNMDNNAERMVRDIEQQVDLQEIARQLKTTDAQVVSDSVPIVEDFLNVFKNTDGPAPDITEFLRERGATQLLTDEATGASARILNREGVVAVKTIMAQTAEDLHLLAMSADSITGARGAAGNQFDRMVDRLEALVGLVKVTGNKLGGGLRSMGLTNADLKRPGFDFNAGDTTELTAKQVQDWANRIRNLRRIGDPSAADEIQAITRAMALAGGDPRRTVSFGKLMAEIGYKDFMGTMYNSIFSGPITHGRNILGNTYSLFSRPTALAMKGVFGGDNVSYKAAISGYQAIVESVNEAWQVGWRSFQTGDSINAKTKFIIGDLETRAMLQQAEAAATGNTGKETMVGYVKALHAFHNNPYFNWPGRALTGEDDFFKTLVARQEIKMRSTVAALSDAKFDSDLEGGFDSYFKEFSKYMDPETGRILDQSILDVAESATFQNDPGPAINALTRLIEQIPFGKAIIPVVRAPANLMRFGATHLPGINLFIREARDTLMNPATTPAAMVKKAEYEGRMAIGSMAVSMAGMWALADNMTGNGPPPGDARDAWLMTYPPKSIRVGDKWISYEGIQPLASIMSVVADGVMLGKMGSADASERLLAQAGFSIAAAVTDQSYFAGLSALADVLDARRQTPDKVEKTIYNLANNFAPLSGARRALYNTLQPYMMEVDGELQRALNVATGGLVLMGETRVDPISGQETPSFAGNWYNAVSPLRVTPVNEDPVKDMLVNINFQVPGNVSGPEGVEMTAKDRNELNRMMHELGLRERLESVMKDPAFQEAMENHRNRPFDKDNPDQMPPHYRAVWSTWNGVRQNALRMMSTTNMEFRERILDQKTRKRAGRLGTQGAVESLRNAPK
jgi:hypothetical protein